MSWKSSKELYVTNVLPIEAYVEGVIAVERIAGQKGLHPLDVSKIPGCTYCWPQVASVGMTEAKAKASGREVKVGRVADPHLAEPQEINALRMLLTHKLDARRNGPFCMFT